MTTDPCKRRIPETSSVTLSPRTGGPRDPESLKLTKRIPVSRMFYQFPSKSKSPSSELLYGAPVTPMSTSRLHLNKEVRHPSVSTKSRVVQGSWVLSVNRGHSLSSPVNDPCCTVPDGAVYGANQYQSSFGVGRKFRHSLPSLP